MSNRNNSHTEGETYLWGVDPAVVEAAIQRGRVERSKAFHGFWRTLVSYATGHRHDATSSGQSNGRTAKAVAC